MSFANRTFRDNKTGEVVKVIDSFENIAILENKSKVSTDFLTNPELYTEQIDPLNFFNNQGAYNILADKIKNIPTDFIKDEPGSSGLDISSKISVDGIQPAMNESAVVMMSEEDEKAELLRKYGMDPNTSSAVSRQNETFAKLLGEDGADELPVTNRLPDLIPNDEPVQRIEVNRDPQPVQQPLVQQPVVQQVEDPIITMFKNVKRSKDFSISLEIKNKIPRPDFIEMMEDSYNTSIIDFLASEFTDNLLKNPQIIEDMIKQKIKELVYGIESKNSINDQITDSVTQVEKHEPLSFEKEPVLTKDLETPAKPKTTRKPRAKKESTEK
jgi:hypothetical protein